MCFTLVARPPRVVHGNTTTFTTDEPLPLTPGANYRMRVTAVSGAGLKTVQYTDGVIIDTTPPKVHSTPDCLAGLVRQLLDEAFQSAIVVLLSVPGEVLGKEIKNELTHYTSVV